MTGKGEGAFEDAIAELFADAMDIEPSERLSWLQTQSAPETVKSRVASLIRRTAQAEDFLQTAGGLSRELTDLPEGTRVGPWVVRDLHAQGGMGDVYRVERADGHYRQTAALKLMAAMSEKAATLFAAERQTLARLNHPAIARLIDGGMTEAGQPYLVMEYVEGEPLTDRLGKARKTGALDLFLTLCEAVGHAHERLVLHRDIKPSNILIAADGYPKLIDFGITGLDQENDLASGSYTPAYAAPEQLKGDSATVRTDVFGLGVTLSHVLSGQLPERNEEHGIILAEGRSSPELRKIIAKATATDPDERYDSAAALADDIQRYRKDLPVAAADGGRGYRLRKFIRRHRVPVALAGLLLLAMVSGIVGTTVQMLDARRAYALEATARADAEERAIFANTSSQLFAEVTGQAISAEDEGDVDFSRLIEGVKDEAISLLGNDPETARIRLYSLSTLHDRRSDVVAALETLRPIFESEDRQDRATIMSLKRFGTFSGWVGNVEEARQAFDRAEALMLNDPERYAFDRIELVGMRAETEADSEVVASAIRELSAYAEAVSDGSTGDRNDAVALLNRAAQLSSRQGKPEEALSYLERAIAINRTIDGAKATPDLFLTFGLTALNTRLGRIEEALGYSETALEGATQMFGPSVALAQRHQGHGDLLMAKEQYGEAKTHYVTAADLYARYDAAGGDQAIDAAFDVLRAEARLSSPEDVLEPGKAMIADKQSILDANPLAAYQAHSGLGDIAVLSGDTSLAAQSYRQALASARQARSRPDYIASAEAALEGLSGN